MTDEKSREFKRELRYLVLKYEDIDKYISPLGQKDLGEICKIISSQRLTDGKKNHGYVVVADDEPYIEQVWNLIRDNWEPRSDEKSCPYGRRYWDTQNDDACRMCEYRDYGCPLEPSICDERE